MNLYDSRELMDANRYSSLRSYYAAELAGLTISRSSDETPGQERRPRSWFRSFTRRTGVVSPSATPVRQSPVN